MPITRFDRPTLARLRTELEAALAPVAEKLGITLTVGSGTYRDETATLKLELAVVRADGTAVSVEAENFKRYCHFDGLKPEDLNRPFKVGGTEYKIVGYRPKAPKKPYVIARTRDDKRFIATPDMVKRGLGVKEELPSADEPQLGVRPKLADGSMLD
jgi:hypothetical protein